MKLFEFVTVIFSLESTINWYRARYPSDIFYSLLKDIAFFYNIKFSILDIVFSLLQCLII